MDDEDEGDRPPPKRAAAKKAQKVVNAINESDTDDAPAPKKSAKSKGKTKQVDEEDDDFEDDAVMEDPESSQAESASEASEPEEGTPDPPKSKAVAKKKVEVKPTNKSTTSKKRKSPVSDEEAHKGKGKRPAKKPKVEDAPKKKRHLSDPWGLRKNETRKDAERMKAPALEMFYWNRVVVDEYTYLNDKSHTMITTLEATHRWVLSGTPPIHDFASVKTIAVFLGLHLGVDDEDEGPTNNRKGDKTCWLLPKTAMTTY